MVIWIMGVFFDNDVRCVYEIVKSVEFVTFERTRNSETGENYKKKCNHLYIRMHA